MNNKRLIHIACADDHPLVRQGIVSFINMFGGMRVDIEAGNGKELIAQIQKSKQLPDMILLDISMPVMNGYNTLLELKIKWPQIKILILTIQEMGADVVRMIENGASGYLAKNAPPGELKKAIHSIYSDGTYYADNSLREYVKKTHADKVKAPRFTPMELQVISYIHTDLTYEEIAGKIGVTTRSVEGHRDSIFRKLNISNRVSLVVFAIRNGLVSLVDNS
jgi:two-component system, NarL family, invasion response regulator UvrY